MKILSASFALMILTVFSAGQDNWSRFDSLEGGFAVALPAGEPSKTRQVVSDSEGNKIIQYSTAINDGTTRFVIGYYDYPDSIRFSSPQSRDAIIKKMGGKLISDSSKKIAGLPVRDFRFQTVSGAFEIIISARLIVAKSRIYLLQVIFPKPDEGALTEKKIERFFESFKTIDFTKPTSSNSFDTRSRSTYRF